MFSFFIASWRFPALISMALMLIVLMTSGCGSSGEDGAAVTENQSTTNASESPSVVSDADVTHYLLNGDTVMESKMGANGAKLKIYSSVFKTNRIQAITGLEPNECIPYTTASPTFTQKGESQIVTNGETMELTSDGSSLASMSLGEYDTYSLTLDSDVIAASNNISLTTLDSVNFPSITVPFPEIEPIQVPEPVLNPIEEGKFVWVPGSISGAQIELIIHFEDPEAENGFHSIHCAAADTGEFVIPAAMLPENELELAGVSIARTTALWEIGESVSWLTTQTRSFYYDL